MRKYTIPTPNPSQPDSANYQDFLQSKKLVAFANGISIVDGDLHSSLFPFQRDLVRWSLRKGRCALFCDTGMGKTVMQLDWARHAADRAIILAPLAVARQTIREAAKWGIDATYARSMETAPTHGITVTNYEMLSHFDAAKFGAVVLDESSILKSFEGKVRTALIESFQQTPMRLCCTATPAPNDIAEIANHAEFLGIMSRVEMLAAFFVHDDAGWRLKKHAREPFYRWLASWGMSLKRPSDLGYSDDGYELPGLSIEKVIVENTHEPEDRLFMVGMKGITDRSKVRRSTLTDRVTAAASLINGNGRPWIAWVGLNDEGTELANLIPGAVEICGSDSSDFKDAAIQWFCGEICDCQLKKFAKNGKLATWQNELMDIGKNTTKRTVIENSRNLPITNANTLLIAKNICANITPPIERNGIGELTSSEISEMRRDEKDTLTILNTGNNVSNTLDLDHPKHVEKLDLNKSSGLLLNNMNACSINSKEDAQFAVKVSVMQEDTNSPLITATKQELSGDFYVHPATLELENSKIIPNSWNAQSCICGGIKPHRVLVSKVSVIGFGMNFQHCADMVFVGLSDSYEQYYQAIRRCYRFGQTRPVTAHIVLSDVEQAIYQNVLSKEREADTMATELIQHVAAFERAEIASPVSARQKYGEDNACGKAWRVMLGDSADRLKEIESNSIGLSVFSPPFQSLYTYSPTERDLGNSRTEEEFWQHFAFISAELHRVLMPGRITCVHVAQVPSLKAVDGEIGIKDFRGATIRHFQDTGFIYHGEVCIDKCPQAQAIRTKSKGLLFTQLHKDSSWSRPALADYILLFRKPGENKVPIKCDLTNDEWIEWARPIWYGIKETDTLNTASAREASDERHICPLQLGTIERCVRLWSNPDDMVLSPFAGIGSEGYMAVKLGRRFVGCELKPAYWRQAVRNLHDVEARTQPLDLFAVAEDGSE